MEKISFKQIFGGISVTFTVLLLLIIAGSMQGPVKSGQVAATITGTQGSNINKPLDTTGEYKNPPQPVNVFTGTFNPSSPGDVTYQDENNPERTLHYKAIRSDRLKGENLAPVLKLKVQQGSMATWKNIDWSWIDSDQGILYFIYSDELNGMIAPIDAYTGDYQLIIRL